MAKQRKSKRAGSSGLRGKLLRAQSFAYTVFIQPRQFTRMLTQVVRYPKHINDIGRTVNVRRLSEYCLQFEIRQKRYLGRGAYAVSAKVRGQIKNQTEPDKTQISGHVQFGTQYVLLLSFMTLVVALSFSLAVITILFLPLSLLMSAVIGLHWVTLFADRADLQTQLTMLIDSVEYQHRAQRLDETVPDLATAVIGESLDNHLTIR